MQFTTSVRLTENLDNGSNSPLYGQRDGEAEGMRLRLVYHHHEAQCISPAVWHPSISRLALNPCKFM